METVDGSTSGGRYVQSATCAAYSVKRERKMQRSSELVKAVGAEPGPANCQTTDGATVAVRLASESASTILVRKSSNSGSGSVGWHGRWFELHEHEFAHEQPRADDAAEELLSREATAERPAWQQRGLGVVVEQQSLVASNRLPVEQPHAEADVAGNANIATVSQMMALAAFCFTCFSNMTDSDSRNRREKHRAKPVIDRRDRGASTIIPILIALRDAALSVGSQRLRHGRGLCRCPGTWAMAVYGMGVYEGRATTAATVAESLAVRIAVILRRYVVVMTTAGRPRKRNNLFNSYQHTRYACLSGIGTEDAI